MIQTEPVPQSIVEIQGIFSPHQVDIAKALGISPAAVKLNNLDSFNRGTDRFLLGFTDSTEIRFEGGFVKFAKDRDNILQLKRECAAMQLAKELGIPSVNVYNWYTETASGSAVAHFERLDGGSGTLFDGKPMLAGADNIKRYGTRAAHALARSLGKPIPHNRDTSFLKRDDLRNKSVASFLEIWSDRLTYLNSDRHAHVLNRIVNVGALNHDIEQVKLEAEDLLKAAELSNQEYFVHNDQAPSNMFFPERYESEEADAMILDFENAGAVKNPRLATITEVADFYRSCGINRELQMEFIYTLLNSTPASQRTEMFRMLKAAMVFGTLLHVGGQLSGRLEPDNPQHYEAVFLLKNLRSNLELLKRQYHQI